jgi:hypothetical protein
MLTPLLLFLIGLILMLCLAPLFSGGRCGIRLAAAATILGYTGGGALGWSFVPAAWPLSLGQTLTASVNARTYGHPTEHYAQGVVLMMLFSCAVGGLLATATAWAYSRFFTPAT